ncbi:hypothetical protein D7Y13_17485 [Corallococcus praedator]|uniref:Uncharacterized protein n=2 Tax=Myxococcaceae TaxID=31 RepID=A0ABX9QJN4_9BACT|nr:hypothetical protein D7X75_03700 [Corallococcus sp. CA031C]RKI07639.1 hypothetical protein D7Y13_17485 [Corallococcus praedator]
MWGLLLALARPAHSQPEQWGDEAFNTCLQGLQGEVENSPYLAGMVKSFSGAFKGLAYEDINLNQPAKARFVNILVPRGGTKRWTRDCGDDGVVPRCWSYVNHRHIVCNPAMGILLAEIGRDKARYSEEEAFDLFARRFWAASVLGHEFGHFLYDKSPATVSHAFPVVKAGVSLNCQQKDDDEQRVESRFDDVGLQLACVAATESKVGKEGMIPYLGKLHNEEEDGRPSLRTLMGTYVKTVMVSQFLYVRDDLCLGTSAYESAAYRAIKMGEGVARCFNDNKEMNPVYDLASKYSTYVESLEFSLRGQQVSGAAAHPNFYDEAVFSQSYVQAPAGQSALVGFANSFSPANQMEYGRIWLFTTRNWTAFDSQLFFEWPGTLRLLDAIFEGNKLSFVIQLKELKQDGGKLRAFHKILRGAITCADWAMPKSCKKSVVSEASWSGKGQVLAGTKSNYLVVVTGHEARAYASPEALQKGTSLWAIKAMFSNEPLTVPNVVSPALFVAFGFAKNGLYSLEGVDGQKQRFSVLDIPETKGKLRIFSVNDKAVSFFLEREQAAEKSRYELWRCPISGLFGKPGSTFTCEAYASLGNMNAFTPAEVISQTDALDMGRIQDKVAGCPANLTFVSYQGWTWVLDTIAKNYALFAGNGIAGCAKDGKVLSYRSGRVDLIDPGWITKALSATTVEVTILQSGEKALLPRGAP